MTDPWCLENAKQLIRQELQELKRAGAVKRTLYQQDLESYRQVQQQLTAQWLKNRSKQTPLHAHISAIRSTDNLHVVPTKVLSQQAQLSSCLFLIEVEGRQQTLVKDERQELVQLLEHQVTLQQEIWRRNSLHLMNQVSGLEEEIKEIQNNMKARGFSITFSNEKETSHGKKEETGSGGGGGLWWLQLVQKHVSNEKKAKKEEPTTTDSSWWPVLDNMIVKRIHTHSTTETSNATETCESVQTSETSSWWPIKKQDKTTHDNSAKASSSKSSPLLLSWWPETKTQKHSGTRTAETSLLVVDGSNHHSVKPSETLHPIQPVQKTWWPVIQPPPPPPEEMAISKHSNHSVTSGVSLDGGDDDDDDDDDDDTANQEPVHGTKTWWPMVEPPLEEKTTTSSTCMSDDSNHSDTSNVSYELRPTVSARQFKPETLDCASSSLQEKQHWWNISLSSDTSL